MTQIRVAYMDHAAERGGGAEAALVDLLRYVDRQLVEPWLIVAEHSPWLRDVEIPAERLFRFFPDKDPLLERSRESLGSWRANLRSLGAVARIVWRLARLLRRLPVQIVHTNSLKTHVLGGLAARSAGKQLVWDVRDILEPGPARRWLIAVARLTRPHIIAMSEAVARALSEAQCPTTVVYGGRNPEEFGPEAPSPALREALDLTPENEVVIIIARLTPWKGHKILLEAFQQVYAARPQARLLVVGAPTFWEASYAEELQQYGRKLGLDSAIRWLGFRSDIPALLALSDVLTLPSFNEPFGIVLVEAMLAGKPVIACDTGGPPEIVEDGITGLIVPTGDPQALAQAILRVLSDPPRARLMGQRGRERAIARFDIRQSVRQIEEIYRALIHTGRASV